MLKKRLIFTLLFNNGAFVLSRNFRLQRVGDIGWLQNNYGFSKVSFYIDELIVLDVTRGEKNKELFCRNLEALAKGCFVPIAAGGGVRSVDDARRLLRSGADKIVVNAPLFDDRPLVAALAREFGQQCVVGSVDVNVADGGYEIWTGCGGARIDGAPKSHIRALNDGAIGELYLNSMQRDGTGQGYDLAMLDILPEDWSAPVILAGGVGNAAHLAAGLAHPKVDAAATAHLFNFVGDGLKKARESLIAAGHELAGWPPASALPQLAARRS
jgi:imidazole glycerol-phosphate synthase subunit HisF